MSVIRAGLFDLDGTLLDTAGDLVASANRMRAALGLVPLPADTIASFIGKGTRRLVERCLSATLDGRIDAPELDRAMALFMPLYTEENGRHARLYPGVVEGLREFAADGLRLACVTNKPEGFTLPLLQQLDLIQHFEFVVSGDSLPRQKPDPLPFAHACERFGFLPAEAVVIGDSQNDAIAGRAAGCKVICVSYGYREGVPAQQLPCDALVDDLRQAAALVRGWNRA